MLTDVFLCSRKNKHTVCDDDFFFCILYVFERVIGIIGTVINLLEIKWWCLKLALDQLCSCYFVYFSQINVWTNSDETNSTVALLRYLQLYLIYLYVIYSVRLEGMCDIILSLLKIVIILLLSSKTDYS